MTTISQVEGSKCTGTTDPAVYTKRQSVAAPQSDSKLGKHSEGVTETTKRNSWAVYRKSTFFSPLKGRRKRRRKRSWAWRFMSVNTTFGRIRKEDCYEF